MRFNDVREKGGGGCLTGADTAFELDDDEERRSGGTA